MNQQEYFLGLDMGTSSVGWAVTNEKYELIRKKGKDMWGIREFEKANSAAERRTNRVSRRRNERNKIRVGIVKSYFANELEKVDPNFLARLDNSKYHFEDKDENAKSKHVLFNDEDYSDIDYFRDYPTIFHLRKELIDNSDQHDVRLVYLAVINLFKRRGHFLNESLGDAEDTRNMNDIYEDFCSVFEQVNINDDGTSETFPATEVAELAKILSDREKSRTEKCEKVAELLHVVKKDSRYEYIKLLCGLSVDAKKLFSDFDSDEKVSICFNDFSYEEKIPELMSVLGDSRYELVAVAKELYDTCLLSGLLNGYKYLSHARVDEYNKHKRDLAELKEIYKKYKSLEDYRAMFKSDEPGSYGAYVNFNKTRGDMKRRNMGGNTQRNLEAFYGRVKKELKGLEVEVEDQEIIERIYRDMDNGIYIQKQLTAANGVIPNQIHRKEIKKILRNAEKYLPFLLEKDESGLTVSERIIQLYEFKIPYYIGPVTERSAKSGGNGWVVRKESGTVYPWNIYQKIDEEQTATAFIQRMVRECTYLKNEKVMPKMSLEYEAYCVLNEINVLAIDGERISVELKQDIYRDLFQKGKKVTRNQLVNYLKSRGALDSEAQLTGIDININNSLSSYGKFKAIFGNRIDEDDIKKVVEQIIYYGTIFGDSKKLYREKIKSLCQDILSENDVKRVLGYKFKDWGKLSKSFLELSGCNRESGEAYSLIRALWENNYNLMELINSDQFTFKQELEERRSNALKELTEIKYEDLEGYYFSAPVRRMVWQTLLLVQEITHIMGCPPKRIFLEMTRSEGEKGEKGRTNSRKKQLLDLYKNVKDDLCNWKQLIEREDASGRLKSKKMYLYITQLGRDMYTGKPIDLDKLFNDNIYDIDHIYPRSFVKDDNLNNNLVLVDKTLNNRKQNYYPIDNEIASNPNVRQLWDMLHQNHLITDEKYHRLTSRKGFTDEQKAGFIARQLVETSQAAKGIADIIKSLCHGTEIVYSKAGNVSDFRRDFDLVKSRLVNEFHHANDAYLNIVVGNAYYVKFTTNPRNFIFKEYARDSIKHKYHLGKMFENDIVRGNEIGWIAQSKGANNPGTIATVKKMMSKNTPLMTRMNFEGHGAIAKATIYGAEKASYEAYIPLKSCEPRMRDVKKYGGYTAASIAYFVLVESESKGKLVRSLEAVPIYMTDKIAKNNDALIEYLEDKLEMKNPRICLDKIKIQSLLKINGYNVYISGKTNKQIALRNAVNLALDINWIKYIKKMEKVVTNNLEDESISRERNVELFELLKDKHEHSIFSKRPNPVGVKLDNKTEVFEKLGLLEQCKVLVQILNLSIIGVPGADLSLIGEAAKAGKMQISKNLTDCSEAKLINQSITGIYTNEVDLLKV